MRPLSFIGIAGMVRLIIFTPILCIYETLIYTLTYSTDAVIYLLVFSLFLIFTYRYTIRYDSFTFIFHTFHFVTFPTSFLFFHDFIINKSIIRFVLYLYLYQRE